MNTDTLTAPQTDAPVAPQTDKPAELDEVGKVLVRAAAIIRERGLRKGWYGGWGEKHCALGAIAEAHSPLAGGDIEEWLSFPPVVEAVRRAVSSFGMELYTFNDAPGRTAEEVATALERAAWGV